MGKTKDKKQIPMYEMERNGFYLLLRIRMEKQGNRSINGVGREFFAPETYRKGKRILADLKKRDLVTEQDGNVLLSEGLGKALDLILQAPHCMNFQNALLQKKGQILTFYYADGAYAGVLIDQKRTMLVVSEEEDVLYKAFEKQLEDRSISRDQDPEQWDRLWSGGTVSAEEGKIQKPVRAARITHCGNRMSRERFQTALLADRRRIQIVRGADSLPEEDLNRETAPAEAWYGVILRELERLKIESRGKGADRPGRGEEKKPREKSEYERVTEIPGFPGSGTGFLFWSLKRVILGLPRMLLGMIRRRSLALLLYPLWGAFLVFYNLYMTCYVNDTFMLDRRARLGNLSPYLMAGTLRTPSYLKGFQVNWGLIDTSFLVWPLMMTVTLLLRHLILQIRRKKAGFLTDLAKIPGAVRDCAAHGYGKGNSLWKVLAAVWLLGFAVMNPITIFLMALLAVLMFAQGTDSALVQTAFLWECAACRKKVDAGERPEPDSRKYRMLLFAAGAGLGVYGLISLLLWFAVDYNWWIRLAVTVLMVLFALLQIFMPKGRPGKVQTRTFVLILLCLIFAGALVFAAGHAGVVFADDGGWTESGGWIPGLLENAGFSTILGISILTIGLGLGGSLALVGTLGLLAGGLTFLTGMSDTGAGEYVRKSAHQYFFGADPDEKKTLFCSAAELLNFASGFANPTAGMTGTTLKVFYGGKVVGDAVSAIGDIAGTIDAAASALNGEGSWIDAAWGGLGLVLDFVGMKGDYDDLKKVWNNPNLTGRDMANLFREQSRELQNRQQSDLDDLGNRLDGQRRADIHAENQRHQNQVDRITNDIRRLENGELAPRAGMDSDMSLRDLKNTLAAEDGIHANNRYNIQNRYESELRRQSEQIVNAYKQEKMELVKKTVVDVVVQHKCDISYEILDRVNTPDRVKEAISFLRDSVGGAGSGGSPSAAGPGTGSPGADMDIGDVLHGGAGYDPSKFSMEEFMDLLEELPEEELECLLTWMQESV